MKFTHTEDTHMKTQLTSIVVASLLLVGCGSDEPLTPEQQAQKKLNRIVTQLQGECRSRIRSRAKYPEKVDFHYSTQYKELTMDDPISIAEFPDFPHKLMYGIKADMMNTFGAMLPQTGLCQVNFNIETNQFNVIEVRVI